MKIEAWFQTDVGLKRENNQDSVLCDLSNGIFIVADGMGGHRGGEVASAMAIEVARRVILEEKKKSPINPNTAITKAYQRAAIEIYEKGSRDSNLRGMATTMVMCLVHEDKIYIGNVGDSRAYLLAAPGMWQLTEDHSLFNEQLKAGLLRESDKEKFDGKNIITRSVGFELDVNTDVIEKKMSGGEMILLCSDGMHGLVSDIGIASICFSTEPPQTVDRLIQEAKSGGGDDNISVLLLKCSVHP